MEQQASSLLQLPWLSLTALGFAIAAAAILIWFLLRRPPLSRTTKVILLFGIGVFPIGSALTGNLAGYQRTMKVDFCGSCHTMGPYVEDVRNPDSTTLASMHSRNPMFGGEACYTCHANYGMFGTISTKASGMKHVWHYYTHYRSVPIEQSLPQIELYEPYPNGNCMQCHSTTLTGWNETPEHASSAELVRSGELGCASEGCHGPAHPFSKVGRKEAQP